MKISRRKFVAAGLLAAAAGGMTPLVRRRRPRFTGSIVGANSALGHAMRDGKFPAITETSETGIVIVGSGIAGLAAARRLKQSGFQDFRLLELEEQPGGNARSGQNEVSAYPWGAHYVPLAGTDDLELQKLFRELGVIAGIDSSGVPVYAEEYLCADPMERLFAQGRWQEGLIPQLGVTATDQKAIKEFLSEMQQLKMKRGRDGRRAFAIPIDLSSQDPEFARLDAITMSEYLRSHGWYESSALRWYVDYCCRDDYGAGIDTVSAWAGVHYFASRDGRAANAADYAVVTWPEGNGWFVQQLRSGIENNLQSGCAVWNVEEQGANVFVDYYDSLRRKSVRLKSRGVVWSAPRFVARRAIASLRANPSGEAGPVYSPWLVANLTLDNLPVGHGMDLAWDNVFYYGRSLGYVVATHQNLTPVPRRTVITYYQPLDEDEPAIARQKALNQPYSYWSEKILTELRPAHPEIESHLTHLDVCLWGHAMVRPVPGYIWGTARKKFSEAIGRIEFAHSDLSGISIFEEAYTRGVRAANNLLQKS